MLPFMPGCVLHKASFVTEAVATVFPHAVEMGLMFPVSTMVVTAVLVESGISGTVSYTPL